MIILHRMLEIMPNAMLNRGVMLHVVPNLEKMLLSFPVLQA